MPFTRAKRKDCLRASKISWSQGLPFRANSVEFVRDQDRTPRFDPRINSSRTVSSVARGVFSASA